MDAIRALIPGDLAPAGNPVILKPRLPLPAFSGYRDFWLNSGTAALALACLHAHWRRLEVAEPEVILPAYGCPDLVAATVYAGARPVLVDTEEKDPGYNLEALRTALNANTVAVVAVNFLGVAERLKAIRQLLPPGTALIEDNAQWHPEPEVRLEGEYVVTSFGRGKPASVLGGGVLLVRKDIPFSREWMKEYFAEPPPVFPSMSRHRLKARTYNLLRRPSAYFWVNRSGLFKLGETRYQPLQGISNMSPACQSLVATNVQHHLLEDRWREGFYDETLAGLPFFEIIARQRRRRLLRYPLLCADPDQRDALLHDLNRQGLGASALYRQSLVDIPGLADKVWPAMNPSNAKSFASRFLSLPLHSGVTAMHMEKIASTLRRLGGARQAVLLQR